MKRLELDIHNCRDCPYLIYPCDSGRRTHWEFLCGHPLITKDKSELPGLRTGGANEPKTPPTWCPLPEGKSIPATLQGKIALIELVDIGLIHTPCMVCGFKESYYRIQLHGKVQEGRKSGLLTVCTSCLASLEQKNKSILEEQPNADKKVT